MLFLPATGLVEVALRTVSVFLVTATIHLFNLAIVEIDLGTFGHRTGTGVTTEPDVGDLRFVFVSKPDNGFDEVF